MKTCSKCGKSKLFLEFRVFPRSADGLSAWCIECHAEASRAHYLKNKDRLNAKSVEWIAANPEKARAIRKSHNTKHKEKRQSQNSQWSKKNRDMRRATAAKRKAAKLRATPAWANQDAIRNIYKSALLAQIQTGFRMHVDHIVPLQSPYVCGLHCEANLQVLRGEENESKKNYWWPDMPIARAQAQGKLFEPEAPKQTQEALL